MEGILHTDLERWMESSAENTLRSVWSPPLLRSVTEEKAPDNKQSLRAQVDMKVHSVAGRQKARLRCCHEKSQPVGRPGDDRSTQHLNEILSFSPIVQQHSRQLRSRLHFSARCRARSHVFAGLSRPRTPVATAPPPYRQEGVYTVHSGHQEAKDLHSSGNRK